MKNALMIAGLDATALCAGENMLGRELSLSREATTYDSLGRQSEVSGDGQERVAQRRHALMARLTCAKGTGG